MKSLGRNRYDTQQPAYQEHYPDTEKRVGDGA